MTGENRDRMAAAGSTVLSDVHVHQKSNKEHQNQRMMYHLSLRRKACRGFDSLKSSQNEILNSKFAKTSNKNVTTGFKREEKERNTWRLTPSLTTDGCFLTAGATFSRLSR